MIFSKRLVTGLVCLLLVPSVTLSQPRDGAIEAYERQSATAQELKASVSRMAIEPVVAALKRKSEDDPQMLQLLSRIEFTATPHLMRPANAYATWTRRIESGGSVEIDLSWFQQVNSIALLAATRVIDPANERGFEYRAGFKYGAELKEALLKGRDLPNFSFNIKEYVSDPLELSYVLGFATRITDDDMAWTVLHEIAHHKLGHLTPGRYDSSKATSRQLELAADDWAYQKMEEMGISLLGVFLFMQMMDQLDQIHAHMGLGYDEAQSTHPTWSRRLKQLKANYDPMKATTGSVFTTFMTKVGLPGPGGQVVIKRITYTFPRDPVAFGCLAFLNLQGEPQEFAITDARGSSLHLLQAPPGQLIDITIMEPDRTITQVVSTVTNRVTGAVKQGTLLAWEQPMTLYGEVTKEGIRVGEAIQTSMRSFFIDFLRETTTDPDVQRRAIAVLDRKLQSDCEIGQQFGKGLIGMQEMLNRSQSVGKKYVDNLKAVLGNKDYARLQSNMMASPFTQAGMQQLQKLLNAPPK